MKSAELIKAFARSLGLLDSVPTADEEYLFVFDDTLEIRLLPEGEESIVIYGTLGNLSDDPGSCNRMLRTLLTANIDTKVLADDCVLSLDKEKREIVLYRRLDSSNMSTDTLSKVIEKYLNELESSKNALEVASSTWESSPFILLP